MFEINMMNLKARLMWVAVCLLLTTISVQSASLSIMTEPHVRYSLTVMIAVSQTLAALAMMQAFTANWWIRPIVVIITFFIIMQVVDYSTDWARAMRWPTGRPENDQVYNEAGSAQALAGGMAILASVAVAAVWLALSFWLSKIAKSATRDKRT